MKSKESDLQISCVSWFRQQHTKLAGSLFAIPNGGKRSKITAAILKREGVLAGVPDLFLAKPAGGYNGLFIEMKVKGNYPTAAQKEAMGRFVQDGYKCEVAYSLDEFRSIVGDYLKPGWLRKATK